MSNPEFKPEGSYAKGALGALIGALIGAIVWAVVYMLGVIAGIVGLLIGWLAIKGYDKMGGKQSKSKIVILIVCIIIGVLVGTYVGLIADCYSELSDFGLTMDQIIEIVNDTVAHNSELRGEVIRDVVMGLAFAGLGVFSLLRNEAKKMPKKEEIQQ